MKPPSENLRSTFVACAKLFCIEAFYEWKSEDGEYTQRQSIMCRIYEALIDDDMGCNALGNNLNEAMEDIKAFLENPPNSTKEHWAIRDYLMRLYLVVERVYEALKVVDMDHDSFKLSTDGMRSLREVKQWANFFKHPGAFLWCHNPVYHCLSYEPPISANLGFLIDQGVVNKYYTLNSKLQNELHLKLCNATNIHVIFPDLIELTRRFCVGIDDFCKTLSSPFFRDRLKIKSTIDKFFEDQSDSLVSNPEIKISRKQDSSSIEITSLESK